MSIRDISPFSLSHHPAPRYGQPPLLNQLLTRGFPALGGAPGTVTPMKLIALLSTITALGLAAPAMASAAEFEGTVKSVNRDNRTFRLHDSERGTVRVKVKRSTRFERIAGFRALRAGMRNIEVTVHRSNGRWVASEVERSGGGGDHGGDDRDDRDDD